MRRAYMRMRKIQRELQAIQLRFNIGYRELARLRHYRPRTPYEAMQLPIRMRRAQQHIVALHYRGQALVREMRSLIRSAQVFTRGSTGERIGSIYEALNLVTEGNEEMNMYVRLGGDLLRILDRAGAF